MRTISLLLPVSQIIARTGPDPALRTDSPTPVSGAPFALELLQALSVTKAPQPKSTGEGPAGALPDQLDPVGAALRALLGGEGAPVVTEDAGQIPHEAEPKESADSSEAELAADLVLPMSVAPAPGSTSESAPIAPERTDPALAQTSAVDATGQVTSRLARTLEAATSVAAEAPADVDLELIHQPEASAQSEADSQPKVATQSEATAQPEVAAQSVAVSEPEGESRANADRSAAQGAKGPPAKGETFDDLVQLITAVQSRDTARHLAKQTAPDSPAEPAVEAPQRPQPASTPDGDPVVVSPVPERTEAAKDSFGQLLPTQSAEARPARTTEIPAPALLNQVTRSLRLLTEGARSELHVKLHPAELGEVLVRLTIQDGLVTARLQTTDAAVKATLDANLDALRARFEQQGLQVNSLAVSTGAGELTDDGQAKSGWTQQSSSKARRSGDDGEGEESEGRAQSVPARRILGRRGLSRLDHLA